MWPRMNDPKVQKAVQDAAEKTGKDAMSALQDPEASYCATAGLQNLQSIRGTPVMDVMDSKKNSKRKTAGFSE